VPVSSRGFYLDGLGTFRTLGHFEFYTLTLAEGAVSFAIDFGVMDEHVLAIVRADEAEAFRVIEPLDGTGSHGRTFYSAQVRIRSKQTLLRRDYRRDLSLRLALQPRDYHAVMQQSQNGNEAMWALTAGRLDTGLPFRGWKTREAIPQEDITWAFTIGYVFNSAVSPRPWPA
jgi:hypothetical protein